MSDKKVMEGVIEYDENMPVTIERITSLWNETTGLDEKLEGDGRLVICASNEAGYNGTSVDLSGLLEWLSKNMPDLYMEYAPTTESE